MAHAEALKQYWASRTPAELDEYRKKMSESLRQYHARRRAKMRHKAKRQATLLENKPAADLFTSTADVQSAVDAAEYQTTAINMRRDQWVMLGDVANARRRKSRVGRQSVSDIIRELIDANQTTLRAELADTSAPIKPKQSPQKRKTLLQRLLAVLWR